MLTRLHVENYKCLRDVTVDLGKFTILIGPNDSGKSSFLEVVRTLGRLTKENSANVFAGDRSLENLVWRRELHRNIVLEAAGSISGDPYVYHLEIPIAERPPIEWLNFRGQKVFEGDESPFKIGNRVISRQWGTTL